MKKENREKLKDAILATYRKGYREGFTDACSLMRNATIDLAQSMEESLEEHTIVVDEEEKEWAN